MAVFLFCFFGIWKRLTFLPVKFDFEGAVFASVRDNEPFSANKGRYGPEMAQHNLTNPSGVLREYCAFSRFTFRSPVRASFRRTLE